MVCGRVRVGTGAAQHILVTMGLGHSHAARASLVSVLKGGWGGEGPNYRSRSRGRVYLPPPVQRALWKLEERIVNPKDSSMKGSLGGKSDCLKPKQYELPCEQ